MFLVNKLFFSPCNNVLYCTGQFILEETMKELEGWGKVYTSKGQSLGNDRSAVDMN